MNKKILWRLVGFLPLCLAFLAMSGGTVFAQTAPTTSQGSTPSSSDTTTRSYWTSERQNGAISADTLVQGQNVSTTTSVVSATGPAVSMAPTFPTGSKATTQAANGNILPASAIALSYPYQYPWSTVGKVFFTDPATHLNYVCSGTAVSSNNKSTVDTAGHCVASGGQKRFYSNWAFCPQYYKTCPSGYLWTARRLWTHSNWYNNGWFAYDYGEAVMNTNTHGYLVNYIGGAGWAYNHSYNQSFYAFGFPAAAPFDGTRMWYCASSLYRYDHPSSGPTALGINCNMTGGSSGGGWLISINGTFGYVNGHNDYKYNNDTAHMYSPYYGSDWYSVFNAAQNS